MISLLYELTWPAAPFFLSRTPRAIASSRRCEHQRATSPPPPRAIDTCPRDSPNVTLCKLPCNVRASTGAYLEAALATNIYAIYICNNRLVSTFFRFLFFSFFVNLPLLLEKRSAHDLFLPLSRRAYLSDVYPRMYLMISSR